MTSGERRRVPIDRIDEELRALWRSATGTAVTRTQTMNVVGLCATPDEADRASRALGAVAATHGARTLLVRWRSAATGEPAQVAAEVALHTAGPGGAPRGDGIFLEAIGGARAWVVDTVARLLTPDLPVYAWWVGDLPDDDTTFDAVAKLADIAVFNSGEMDLRDLGALDELAKRSGGVGGRCALADFLWQRLRHWQELTARFFDDPPCTAEADRIETVNVRFNPRPRDPEPISNQAALYVGWLTRQLGARMSRWESRDPRRPIARFERKGEGAAPLTVAFEAAPRQGVVPGAPMSVELVGSSAATRFRITRSEDDPLVFCWSAEVPGARIPCHSLRIRPNDDAKLLSRVLERPVRDRYFEESLHAAASLVRDIAPPAPSAPVSAPVR